MSNSLSRGNAFMNRTLASLPLQLLVLYALWGGIGASCSSHRKEEAVFDKYAAKVCFLIHTPDVRLMEINILSNYTSLYEPPGIQYSIRQTSRDNSGKMKEVPGPVIIADKPQMIQQCGTYDIVVSVNGDVTRISDFRYSGEKNVEVARGIGWSIHISRDTWIQELEDIQ